MACQTFCRVGICIGIDVLVLGQIPEHVNILSIVLESGIRISWPETARFKSDKESPRPPPPPAAGAPKYRNMSPKEV